MLETNTLSVYSLSIEIRKNISPSQGPTCMYIHITIIEGLKVASFPGSPPYAQLLRDL